MEILIPLIVGVGAMIVLGFFWLAVIFAGAWLLEKLGFELR